MQGLNVVCETSFFDQNCPITPRDTMTLELIGVKSLDQLVSDYARAFLKIQRYRSIHSGLASEFKDLIFVDSVLIGECFILQNGSRYMLAHDTAECVFWPRVCCMYTGVFYNHMNMPIAPIANPAYLNLIDASLIHAGRK